MSNNAESQSDALDKPYWAVKTEGRLLISKTISLRKIPFKKEINEQREVI